MNQNINEKINSTYNSEIPPKEMFITMKQNTYNFYSNNSIQKIFPEYFSEKSKIFPLLRKINDKIGFKSQTFFLSLYYLDIIYSNNQNKKLQNNFVIISLSCLVISAKYCENDPVVPKLRSFINLYNYLICYKNTLTLRELFYYEVVCLKLLNYKLNYFTVYDFNSFLLGHGLLKKTQIKDIMNSNYNVNFYNSIYIVKKILEKIYKKSRYYLDCFMATNLSCKYNSLLISIYIMKKSVEYVLLKEHKLKKYDYSAKEQIIEKNSKCFNEVMLEYYNLNFESNEEYQNLINDKEFIQIFNNKNLLIENNNFQESEYSKLNKEDKTAIIKNKIDELQKKILNLKKLGNLRISGRYAKNNEKDNCNSNVSENKSNFESKIDYTRNNPSVTDLKKLSSKFDISKKKLIRSNTQDKLIEMKRDNSVVPIVELKKSKSKSNIRDNIFPLISPMKIYNKRNIIIPHKSKKKISSSKIEINDNNNNNNNTFNINNDNKINIDCNNKKNESIIKNHNSNSILGNNKNIKNMKSVNIYNKINIHKNNTNSRNNITHKNNNTDFKIEYNDVKKNIYNNKINKNNINIDINNKEKNIDINNKIDNNYYFNYYNNYTQFNDKSSVINSTDPSKTLYNYLCGNNLTNQPSNKLLNKDTDKSNKLKVFSKKKNSNKPYLKKVVTQTNKKIQNNRYSTSLKNKSLFSESNNLISNLTKINSIPFPNLLGNNSTKNGEDIHVNLYEVNNYSTVINKKNITNNFISEPKAIFDLKKKISFNEKNSVNNIKNNEAFSINNSEKNETNKKLKMLRSRAYTTKIYNMKKPNINQKSKFIEQVSQNSGEKDENNLIEKDQIYLQTFYKNETQKNEFKPQTILNSKEIIYPTNKKINYFDYYFYNYNENNNDDVKKEEEENNEKKRSKVKKKKKKKKVRDKNNEDSKEVNYINNNTIV